MASFQIVVLTLTAWARLLPWMLLNLGFVIMWLLFLAGDLGLVHA